MNHLNCYDYISDFGMQRMMTFLRLTSLLFLAAKMRSLRFTLPHGAAELNSFSCQVLPIHRNGLEKNVLSTRLKFSNLVEWNRLSMVKKLLLFPGILPDLIAHFIEMSSEKMNFQHGWNFRISLNGIDWAWCQDNFFFVKTTIQNGLTISWRLIGTPMEWTNWSNIRWKR